MVRTLLTLFDGEYTLPNARRPTRPNHTIIAIATQVVVVGATSFMMAKPLIENPVARDFKILLFKYISQLTIV